MTDVLHVSGHNTRSVHRDVFFKKKKSQILCPACVVELTANRLAEVLLLCVCVCCYHSPLSTCHKPDITPWFVPLPKHSSAGIPPPSHTRDWCRAGRERGKKKDTKCLTRVKYISQSESRSNLSTANKVANLNMANLIRSTSVGCRTLSLQF